jgi:hypothetical protein
MKMKWPGLFPLIGRAVALPIFIVAGICVGIVVIVWDGFRWWTSPRGD